MRATCMHTHVNTSSPSLSICRSTSDNKDNQLTSPAGTGRAPSFGRSHKRKNAKTQNAKKKPQVLVRHVNKSARLSDSDVESGAGIDEARSGLVTAVSTSTSTPTAAAAAAAFHSALGKEPIGEVMVARRTRHTQI